MGEPFDPDAWQFKRVLDHGYVKLIDSMGNDSTVVEAARMSTGKGFLGWEPAKLCVKCGCHECSPEADLGPCGPEGKDAHRFAQTKGDAHLLEFLYRNKHMTPFEMCELSVEIYAPIFVFRELMRHRTFSFNEFSARYAQMPNEHYVPDLDRFTPKQTGNKQADSARLNEVVKGRDIVQRDCVEKEQQRLYETYDALINEGVPKEVARINTPVSRMSRARMKGNLRNFLQMLALRLPESAQWETRQYANAVAELVKRLWPRTWALFEEYTLGAVTFSRSEMQALKHMLNPECLDDSPEAKAVWKKASP
jgi:thymidylate synthase (FAD)